MCEAVARNRKFASGKRYWPRRFRRTRMWSGLRALRWGCPSIGTTARLADDLSKRFPEDTQVGIDRTMIQAGILMNRGDVR